MSDRITPKDLGEAIASHLTELLADREVVVVGPLDDGETVLVIQRGGYHLLIQVNNAELMIR